MKRLYKSYLKALIVSSAISGLFVLYVSSRALTSCRSAHQIRMGLDCADGGYEFILSGFVVGLLLVFISLILLVFFRRKYK